MLDIGLTMYTLAGEKLRGKRIAELKLGLREMSRLLGISAAHLTDIEKGRHRPSDSLLVQIAEKYQMSEHALRALWQRMDAGSEALLTKNEITSEKASEFLRVANRLNRGQWDQLIEKAVKMASKRGVK